jgi:nucleoside-diphosphate-sugar epimerase
LTIYGDGSQTRSYCFVADLVAGIAAMVATQGAVGQTINLGNPEEKTVRETGEAVLAALGKDSGDAAFSFKPLPSDDPTRRKPDISKAQQLLGWQPTVSFEEGIKRTIGWFRG